MSNLTAALESAPGATSGATPALFLQRKCACGGAVSLSGDCSECKKQEQALQRKATGPDHAATNSVPSGVREVLQSPGQPLDPATRAFMEPRLGHNFSQVRVHTDAQAAQSAQAVNALAYTVGRDIVFGTGQYSPHSFRGRWMLAHELVHVAQQGAKAQALPSQLNISIPGDPYEVEADREAHRALIGSNGASGPYLDSSLTIQRVGPGLIAAGVLAAMASCAYGFYRYTLDNYSGRQGYNDKFMHCYTSCKVASWCGGGPFGPNLAIGLAWSEALGILKEIADYIKNELHIGTPADASWEDWIADQYGLLCALNLFSSCASCCRNAPGAVSPGRSAAHEVEAGSNALASAEPEANFAMTEAGQTA